MFPLICFGQNAKEIARRCMSSTVSIIMKDQYMQPVSIGSGFILASGKIVTNLHVIEECRYGSVIISGQEQEHKIQGWLNVDKVNDLAILSVPSIGSNSLQLSTSSNPAIGEKIYAIGSPQGLSGTISEGIISSIRKTTEKTLIQITAPISPGSSGGPVIGNDGKVVGVAVSTLASGQNLNFAIPISKVRALNQKTVNSINKLNFGKNITAKKSSASEIDISDGLTIKMLEEGYVSIRNRTPYGVSNISYIMISYGDDGYPIDFKRGKLFKEQSVWGWECYNSNSEKVSNYETLKKEWYDKIESYSNSGENQKRNIAHSMRRDGYPTKELCLKNKNACWQIIINADDKILLPYLAKKMYVGRGSSSRIVYRILDFNVHEL